MLITNRTTEALQRKMARYNALDIDEIYRELNIVGVKYITVNDALYPVWLKEIHDPPYILFYRGDISLLQLPSLSIVGSRKCTIYTRIALRELLQNLKDIAIVSGLAYGADEYAHKTAILHQLPTIGVLAFGHKFHYPKVTEELRNTLDAEYLTISEYPPNTTIDKWQFVARNRIIAGLSSAVLVTEAELGSGSLITLEMAMDENRTAMCLPGNITSKFSVGTNHMLAEGAKMVLSSDDIIEEIVMREYLTFDNDS